jgi:hypothetical protein
MQYVCEELNMQVIIPCNDPFQFASFCVEPDYMCYLILEFALHCSLQFAVYAKDHVLIHS